MNEILIVMGVSGVGKTTVGQALADDLRVSFFDADDFHSPENVAKMQSGKPLDDHDREPWLQGLNEFLLKRDQDTGAVLACSALKQKYRLTLGKGLGGRVRFVFLDAPEDFLAARVAQRHGHFMPTGLLRSQFAALEIPEEGLRVDARGSVADIVAKVVAELRRSRQ